MADVRRIIARYLESFRYEPKESKKTKVDRLAKALQSVGLSKGISSDVADAYVRHRDLQALNTQKGWDLNIDGSVVKGPKGSLDLAAV